MSDPAADAVFLDAVFHAPSPTNAKIWRYMDFTQFVSMLEHGGLFFFCRLDYLQDRFEGSLSRAERGVLGQGGHSEAVMPKSKPVWG